MAKPTGDLLRATGGVLDTVAQAPGKSGGKFPQPKPAKPKEKPAEKPAGLGAPPMLEDPDVNAAKAIAREAERRRKGRRSTIVTGGTGVLGSAPLSRPQALGA